MASDAVRGSKPGLTRLNCFGWCQQQRKVFKKSPEMTGNEKILNELQRQSKDAYVSPYMIAVIYAGLGQKDKAFELLEKAYKERSPDIAYFLNTDLWLDPLRPDPRFLDLLRRVDFPQ